MTSKLVVDELLAECEREEGRFDWEGTFADYLRIVSEAPSVSRLSHKLVYDAINAKGVEQSASGDPVYNLFKGQIFGLDTSLTQIVHYFASSSHRLETRNRILLLLGPPAGGKSSIVALLKRALEDYTRTEEGGVYAIKGCPMQEEPLHLVPHPLRGKIYEEHGIYIEGDLCPRCRYLLRSRYKPTSWPSPASLSPTGRSSGPTTHRSVSTRRSGAAPMWWASSLTGQPSVAWLAPSWLSNMTNGPSAVDTSHPPF